MLFLELLQPRGGRLPLSVLLLEGCQLYVHVLAGISEVASIEVNHHIRFKGTIGRTACQACTRRNAQQPEDCGHAPRGLRTHKVLERGCQCGSLAQVKTAVAQVLLQQALEVLGHPLRVEVWRQGLVRWLQANDKPTMTLKEQAVECIAHGLMAQVARLLFRKRGVHGLQRSLQLAQSFAAGVSGKLRQEVPLDICHRDLCSFPPE
mmetsp:Transcript_27748/g.79709  ORF Transcript_27748/g.79709 Transcript_27748/m.79709 type:complete len:206 (+) Transcript_27748:187-804(+)